MHFEKLLDGNESVKAVIELIEVLKTEENAVLIGAGASVESGYRSWEEFILGNDRKVGLSSLLQDFVPSEAKDYLGIAEKCFLQSPNDYLAFLKKEFGEENITVNAIALLLKRLNLSHYLTTNFDRCLIDAIPTRSFNSYPIFRENFHEPPVVTYLHGRAFKFSSEDDDKLNFFLENMILRSSIYKEAYSVTGTGNSLCISFLRQICKKYNLLFIGFSFMDDFVLNAIKSILQQSQKQVVLEKRYDPDFPETKKLIFIFREKDSITAKDRQLEEFGNVRIIKYQKYNPEHIGLKEILNGISNELEVENLPQRMF